MDQQLKLCHLCNRIIDYEVREIIVVQSNVFHHQCHFIKCRKDRAGAEIHKDKEFIDPNNVLCQYCNKYFGNIVLHQRSCEPALTADKLRIETQSWKQAVHIWESECEHCGGLMKKIHDRTELYISGNFDGISDIGTVEVEILKTLAVMFEVNITTDRRRFRLSFAIVCKQCIKRTSDLHLDTEIAHLLLDKSWMRAHQVYLEDRVSSFAGKNKRSS